jgi:hypothetical protein
MPRPPGRALLRVAGVLTQLSCGVCLLIGTIGLVLVQQNRTGQSAEVAVWLAGAMAGLVFGGLVYRGGLVSMVVAAAIDAAFGAVLVIMERGTLGALLKILPASDVDAIADALRVAGYTMIGVAALCLAAVPQGLRFSRWFRDAAATRTAMSTARGFPPPPVSAYTSVMIIPAEEAPGARRRLYLVLGGLAIGVGAGIGVLVSSTQDAAAPAAASNGVHANAATNGRATPGANRPGAAHATVPGAGSSSRSSTVPGGGSSAGSNIVPNTVPGAGSGAVPGAGSNSLATARPPERPLATAGSAATPQALVIARRAALAKASSKALEALLLPSAFAFGVDADEVADGAPAVAAQMIADLGEMPDTGFAIESRALAIGQDGNHAWIAEELSVSATGRPTRTYAVSELATQLANGWQIVASHWAIPVDDATAQRLAILNTLPTPHPVTDAGTGDLARAVRAAFASRDAFAAARSERPDAFNYGSGGERAKGPAVKKIFSRLRASIRLHDGAHVVDASSWDPSQKAPTIGWAAVNVDFTSKTRAATDVTQTFRVLAILLREDGDWKLVQTHWSNGGPVR